MSENSSNVSNRGVLSAGRAFRLNQYRSNLRQRRLPRRPKLFSIIHDALLSGIPAGFRNPDRLLPRARLSRPQELRFGHRFQNGTRTEKDMKRPVAMLFALSLVALTGCEAMMMRHITSRLKKNPAPDFELTALDGETVRLSELRGKPVLLSFWAFG